MFLSVSSGKTCDNMYLFIHWHVFYTDVEGPRWMWFMVSHTMKGSLVSRRNGWSKRRDSAGARASQLQTYASVQNPAHRKDLSCHHPKITNKSEREAPWFHVALQHTDYTDSHDWDCWQHLPRSASVVGFLMTGHLDSRYESF